MFLLRHENCHLHRQEPPARERDGVRVHDGLLAHGRLCLCPSYWSGQNILATVLDKNEYNNYIHYMSTSFKKRQIMGSNQIIV